LLKFESTLYSQLKITIMPLHPGKPPIRTGDGDEPVEPQEPTDKNDN